MNQLWQFGSKLEEEINSDIEENVSSNTKKHVRTFGSHSQGCIHLLKIIAGITIVVLPIQFPRVGIFGPIF
jgi:hypothetical protein